MKTRGKKGNGKFRRQRQAVAKNKLLGMSDTEAVLKAGYAPNSVDKNAWKIVRHPEVQSVITASCQRIMEKRNLEFDAILEPLFDALQAKVVVKSATLLQAVETEIVDHTARVDAASRLIDLHRVKQVPEEDESKQAPPVNLTINFVKTGTKVSPIVVNRPANTPTSTIPGVSFVKR